MAGAVLAEGDAFDLPVSRACDWASGPQLGTCVGRGLPATPEPEPPVPPAGEEPFALVEELEAELRRPDPRPQRLADLCLATRPDRRVPASHRSRVRAALGPRRSEEEAVCALAARLLSQFHAPALAGPWEPSDPSAADAERGEEERDQLLLLRALGLPAAATLLAVARRVLALGGGGGLHELLQLEARLRAATPEGVLRAVEAAGRGQGSSALQRRLEAFYRQHNPDKVGGVAALLREHHGREPQLLFTIQQKYGAGALPPDPQPGLVPAAFLRDPSWPCLALPALDVLPRVGWVEVRVPEEGCCGSPVAAAPSPDVVLLDLRPAEEFAAGHVQHAVHLAPSLLLAPPSEAAEAMDAVLDALRPHAGRATFVLQAAGSSGTYDAVKAARAADRELLRLATAHFLRRGFPFVCCMGGGFAAVHKLLGPAGLQRHDERRCRPCRVQALTKSLSPPPSPLPRLGQFFPS